MMPRANRKLRWLVIAVLLGSAFAQTAPSAQTKPEPVSYSSLTELNQLLAQLEQTSATTQADLAKLRIERWKTNSDTKRQTQANVDSLTRNLHEALPEMILALQSSPENLAATFKLYRNLDALYDVFGSVVEAAGAFGSNDDFQSLGNDLTALERTRHSFAERMDTLATSKETEISSLRVQVKSLQTPPPAAATTKTVVDDTQPAPKPAKKKRVKPPAPPSPAATTPANQGSSQQSTSQH